MKTLNYYNDNNYSIYNDNIIEKFIIKLKPLFKNSKQAVSYTDNFIKNKFNSKLLYKNMDNYEINTLKKDMLKEINEINVLDGNNNVAILKQLEIEEKYNKKINNMLLKKSGIKNKRKKQFKINVKRNEAISKLDKKVLEEKTFSILDDNSADIDLKNLSSSLKSKSYVIKTGNSKIMNLNTVLESQDEINVAIIKEIKKLYNEGKIKSKINQDDYKIININKKYDDIKLRFFLDKTDPNMKPRVNLDNIGEIQYEDIDFLNNIEYSDFFNLKDVDANILNKFNKLNDAKKELNSIIKDSQELDKLKFKRMERLFSDSKMNEELWETLLQRKMNRVQNNMQGLEVTSNKTSAIMSSIFDIDKNKYSIILDELDNEIYRRVIENKDLFENFSIENIDKLGNKRLNELNVDELNIYKKIIGDIKRLGNGLVTFKNFEASQGRLDKMFAYINLRDNFDEIAKNSNEIKKINELSDYKKTYNSMANSNFETNKLQYEKISQEKVKLNDKLNNLLENVETKYNDIDSLKRMKIDEMLKKKNLPTLEEYFKTDNLLKNKDDLLTLNDNELLEQNNKLLKFRNEILGNKDFEDIINSQILSSQEGKNLFNELNTPLKFLNDISINKNKKNILDFNLLNLDETSLSKKLNFDINEALKQSNDPNTLKLQVELLDIPDDLLKNIEIDSKISKVIKKSEMKINLNKLETEIDISLKQTENIKSQISDLPNEELFDPLFNNNQKYKDMLKDVGLDEATTPEQFQKKALEFLNSNSKSPSDIKKTYRKKARQLHPDKPNGNNTEFQKLTLYYSVLNDPTFFSKNDNLVNIVSDIRTQKTKKLLLENKIESESKKIDINNVENINNKKNNKIIVYEKKSSKFEKISEKIKTFKNKHKWLNLKNIAIGSLFIIALSTAIAVPILLSQNNKNTEGSENNSSSPSPSPSSSPSTSTLTEEQKSINFAEEYLNGYKFSNIWDLSEDEVLREVEIISEEEDDPERASTVLKVWNDYNNMSNPNKTYFRDLSIEEKTQMILKLNDFEIKDGEIYKMKKEDIINDSDGENEDDVNLESIVEEDKKSSFKIYFIIIGSVIFLLFIVIFFIM